jgi:hypothetical protein
LGRRCEGDRRLKRAHAKAPAATSRPPIAGAEFLNISSNGIIRLQRAQDVESRPDHDRPGGQPLKDERIKAEKGPAANPAATSADPRFVATPETALNHSFARRVSESISIGYRNP